MDEAKQAILQMLQEGKITPEEADGLLAALDNEAGQASSGAYATSQVWNADGRHSQDPEDDVIYVEGEVLPESPASDFERFRYYWRYPFAIALAGLVLCGILLSLILKSSGGMLTSGATYLTGLMLFCVFVMVLAWFGRGARWLHVRVRSAGRDRVRFSMPFSTRFVSWGLRFSRGYANGEMRQYISMAESMVRAFEQNADQEPLHIDIGEGDDRVQIYIG